MEQVVRRIAMRSSRHAFRSLAAAVLGASCWVGTASAGEQPGLRAVTDSFAWPRVAARLGVNLSPAATNTTPGLFETNTPRSPSQVASLNVLGDVYLANSHRFRATGGMLLGPRVLPWSSAALLSAPPGATLVVGRAAPSASDESANDGSEGYGSVPYLGIGYSDASARGGWGFSADFGVLALTPKPAVRLGRVFSGQQSFDDLLRELRLTPSVQVGVSYSF
jgi:hypothetical protein